MAFVALAIASAPATAAPDLNGAVRTAQRVFPSVALRCGVVQLEVGVLSALNLHSSAESYYSACRVRIAPETLRTVSDPQLCSLMVHEWGHLAGLDDSTDPNSVMYPRIGLNPVCGGTLSADQLAANARQERRETIADKLTGLRKDLRRTRTALRRARGEKRARLTKKAKRLEKRIRKLKAELKTLG